MTVIPLKVPEEGFKPRKWFDSDPSGVPAKYLWVVVHAR
jgi:hypothetical protein